MDIENLNKFCRTCLNVLHTDVYEIFDDNRNVTNVADMLNICTSISVKTGDALPKKLCSDCYNCLIKYYQFKIHAENVQKYLMKSLDENKVKEEFEVKLENSCDGNIDKDYSDEEYSNEKGIDVYQKGESCHSCLECQKKIDPENKLTLHRNFKRLVSKLECDICGKIFHDRTQLQVHKPKHLICSEPDLYLKQEEYDDTSILNDKNDADEKVLTKVDQNDFSQSLKCEICFGTFKSMHSLSAHKRVHVKKDRVLSCSLCNKVFKKLSHLKRHELSHEVNRPFKCSLCPKSFATEFYLNEHSNRHCGIKPHQCPLCSKKFSNISSLTTHLKVHTNEKTYLCPTCGKKFGSSTNLNQHMKRHTGIRMYACELCPTAFFSQGELKSHSITHTGEKSYTCDQCNASFTKRCSLEKHKLAHLGLKLHQCEICCTKFTSKGHLKRHQRIHTGEKPYQCDMCERSFTQSNDLVKHKRSHLGDKLYICTHCPERFRLKTELRQHLSEHFILLRQHNLNTDNSNDPNTDPSNIVKTL